MEGVTSLTNLFEKALSRSSGPSSPTKNSPGEYSWREAYENQDAGHAGRGHIVEGLRP